MPRHAAIEIDLDAITSNTRSLADAANGAAVCAVVKADGYGHGAEQSARAALAGGAQWLAVALVEEGVALRRAGIGAPILVLSEPTIDSMADAHDAGLVPTLYSVAGIDAAAAVAGDTAAGDTAAGDAAAGGRWVVHLKIDTGMHRVGADVGDAVELAQRIVDTDRLHLGGVFTHLAVADEPDHPLNDEQLDRFAQVLVELEGAGIEVGLVHAANSAGLLCHSRSHLDMVRVGIAAYGIDPAPSSPTSVALVPAMSLRSEVTFVRDLAPGEGVSYGMRHVFDAPAKVAVVPLGYADGVPRHLGLRGGCVLVGGVRRPIRGVVTMDQLVIEVTADPPVQVGDEVVLIGVQGDDRITAQEWAELTDTIPYEIVCGFSARLPRVHLHGPA